jgi:hypothetical protein
VLNSPTGSKQVSTDGTHSEVSSASPFLLRGALLLIEWSLVLVLSEAFNPKQKKNLFKQFKKHDLSAEDPKRHWSLLFF